MLILVAASPQVVVAQAAADSAEAVALLYSLRGRWEFTLTPHKSSRPTTSGVRVFSVLVAGHPSLTWTEEFDGSELILGGVLGYDMSRSRFYEIGSPSTGPVDYWIGQLSEDGREIAWIDPFDTAAPSRGALRLLNPDVFEFTTPYFRVVFTRSGSGF